MKNRITIYPDADLRKRLEEVCKEENRSLNNFILTTLKNVLKKEKQNDNHTHESGRRK